MNIQYVGFRVTATARVYDFHVIDSLEEHRAFAVQVKTEAFRSTTLKYQQGPEICFLRLKRALAAETTGTPALRQLKIEATDIQDYLERRTPRKRSWGTH